MDRIEVAEQALQDMLAHAERTHPRECCGLLHGYFEDITSAVPVRNVHVAPKTHFEIDPQALIDAHRAAREGGPLVLGYYHSHPNGLARPSATDARMAAGDGAVWAIVAAGCISFWRAGAGEFTALPYEVTPR